LSVGRESLGPQAEEHEVRGRTCPVRGSRAI
jgi:hypothetical protein